MTKKQTLPPQNELEKINEFRNGNLIVDLHHSQYFKNYSKFDWLQFYKQKAKDKSEFLAYEYFEFSLKTKQFIIPMFEDFGVNKWYNRSKNSNLYDVESMVTTTIYDKDAKQLVEVIEIPCFNSDMPRLTMVFGKDNSNGSSFYNASSQIEMEHRRLQKLAYQLEIVETPNWQKILAELDFRSYEQKQNLEMPENESQKIIDILVNYKKWGYNYDWEQIFDKFHEAYRKNPKNIQPL